MMKAQIKAISSREDNRFGGISPSHKMDYVHQEALLVEGSRN